MLTSSQGEISTIRDGWAPVASRSRCAAASASPAPAESPMSTVPPSSPLAIRPLSRSVATGTVRSAVPRGARMYAGTTTRARACVTSVRISAQCGRSSSLM